MTTWLKSYNARILIKRQADDKIILSSACLYHIWRYPLVYPLVSLGNLNLSSAHHLYMEMKVNKLKYQRLIYVLKLNWDLLHSLIYLNCFPHHSEKVCAFNSGIFTGGGLIPSADSTMLGRFLDKIDPLGGAQVPPVPTHIRSDSYGKFKICLKHHPGPHKGPQPTWTLTAPNQTLQQDVGCSSESVPRFTWENLNRGHQWWEKVQGWIFWEFWWTASGHQTTSEGPVVLHPRVKAGTLFEREPVGDRIISILEFQTLLLAIIQGYAPTNKAEKDDWYKELQGTVSKLPLGVQGQQEFKQWRLWQPQGVMARVWWTPTRGLL